MGKLRVARLTTINVGLAFMLMGCSSVGGLLGSGAGSAGSSGSDSASSLASNAGTIADAVEWISGPSDSYCRKEAAPGVGGDAGMIPVYKVTKGDCAEGDTELKEYEYNELVAENEARTWDKLHATAVAEAAKPTYCRTATAGIVYRASAKTCQPGEASITQEEYDAAKAEAAAAATKLP